jgi:hypothetical protein
VTAGYIVTDVERLRGPTEDISCFLFSALGRGEPSNVVPLTCAALPAEAILRETVKNTR